MKLSVMIPLVLSSTNALAFSTLVGERCSYLGPTNHSGSAPFWYESGYEVDIYVATEGSAIYLVNQGVPPS